MTPDELNKKIKKMQQDASGIAKEQTLQGSQRAIATVLAPNMVGYAEPTQNGSKVVFKPVRGTRPNKNTIDALNKELSNNLKTESKKVSDDIARRLTK